ncbi:MAG: hypothetical protein M3329_02135 [Pseudomonadota bacterium]|nr:hypothetical protein [Pseudomonadota bacterium]
MSALSRVLLGLLALTILLAGLMWVLPAERRAHLLSALPALQGKLIESESSQPPMEAGDETETGEAESRVHLIDGAPVVRLTAQEQRYSGLRTALPERVSYRPEIRAYGEVVNIQPLLRLRARYFDALAEQEIADARVQVSVQEYERLSGLNQQGNVISASRVRQAEARRRVDQARLAAAGMRVANLRALALQSWGRVLTDSAFLDDSPRMRRLIDRIDVLLRVTLMPGQRLPSTARIAMIEQSGHRRRAQEASLVSPSPRTNNGAQGKTWFYRMPAADLRTGTRVIAWIPRDRAPTAGLRLPAAAAVWYGGEAWIYVRVDEHLFARRAVPRDKKIAGGWLATHGFSADEPVVVSGGQMLLSEEFRWQIPEEDDD